MLNKLLLCIFVGVSSTNAAAAIIYESGTLGATDVLGREALTDDGGRPLLKETWGGVVDTVGGDILFNAVKGLRYGCSLAACGLVASPAFNATVLPFILRHVNLLGIDSVELPIAEKRRVWTRLADDWQIDGLEAVRSNLSLDDLNAAIDRILAGAMVGRGVVDLSA